MKKAGNGAEAVVVNVRFSTQEYEELKAQAKEDSIPISTLIRHFTMKSLKRSRVINDAADQW
jgi:hypothetical protein